MRGSKGLTNKQLILYELTVCLSTKKAEEDISDAHRAKSKDISMKHQIEIIMHWYKRIFTWVQFTYNKVWFDYHLKDGFSIISENAQINANIVYFQYITY